VRLVGIALGRRRAARLAAWLVEAQAAGADVALICPAGSATGPIRARELARSAPGAAVRALDAEDQLRAVDAVVVAGRRERLALRLAPRALRGVVAPIVPGTAAGAAVAELQAGAR
jgi:hypothetical protein